MPMECYGALSKTKQILKRRSRGSSKPTVSDIAVVLVVVYTLSTRRVYSGGMHFQRSQDDAERAFCGGGGGAATTTSNTALLAFP